VAEIITRERLGNIEQNRRSVDRETVGRNREMKRIIGPEIDRDVKWPTQSLNGEGGSILFVNGENRVWLPGFVPTACCPGLLWEQGRSGGLRRSL